MVNSIFIGMQWGDEGKGKHIDAAARGHKLVARYQGGANAGHSVNIVPPEVLASGDEKEINDKKYKFALHLIPSGILSPGVMNVIGNNVVAYPPSFLKEVDGLRARGVEVSPQNLAVSDRAHLTLLYHQVLDSIEGGGVGTTNRGIGPTYADKARRTTAIRMCDLFDLKSLEEKVREGTKYANHLISYYDPSGKSAVPFEKVWGELLQARERMLPFIHKDIAGLILENNGSLLFESAQGTMLDVDNGTFPFVTSSNPTRGGAYTGTGVWIDFQEVYGILKAYTTRVGNGPLPTEQVNEAGERLRKRGGEFGTTTGRPRRCAWQDLCVADYAIKVNGINGICLTKLDVLDEELTIPVCIGYNIDGKRVDYFPVTELHKVEPVYIQMRGWMKDISRARKPSDLPREAREYISFIERTLKTPIKEVGVGQRRDQIVYFS